MSQPSPAIREPNRLDLGLMVMTSLMLASGFIAVRVAVPETGPVSLAAIRVGIGFLVLLPYAIWRGMVWPASPSQWMLISGMALLNVVAPFILIGWASQSVEASVLSLLMGTGPFLALIGSHLMTDDDRLTRRKLVSVLLGFSGILVLVGPSVFNGLSGNSLMGQLAALGASFCYVAAGLLIRRITIPPVRLAGLALAIGSVVLVPLALITEGLPTGAYSGPVIGALIFLGLFPTGIAYILRFSLIRTVGYTRFSLSINLIPVFGVALGVLILDEPLSVGLVAALVLVLAGLYVSSGKTPAQNAG
ncbi:threonine/homoserine efflux transporter RhtA [Hoeflea halophila]|uniref:Threonine/homoserine efflux transporter RhtA n=1 Tax=Hoeflea halophila TaxID=714899 RepID=A0A286IH41_9HYPH|nr:DMT family transporter [Hoeflea halophila]SOE18679.1 threonine/homoserine efflux transporter RhtA [Hoeflea halophila]